MKKNPPCFGCGNGKLLTSNYQEFKTSHLYELIPGCCIRTLQRDSARARSRSAGSRSRPDIPRCTGLDLQCTRSSSTSRLPRGNCPGQYEYIYIHYLLYLRRSQPQVYKSSFFIMFFSRCQILPSIKQDDHMKLFYWLHQGYPVQFNPTWSILIILDQTR